MNVSLLQSIAHLPGVLIENKNGFHLNHAKLNCVSSFQPKCVFLFRKIKKSSKYADNSYFNKYLSLLFFEKFVFVGLKSFFLTQPRNNNVFLKVTIS